MSEKRDEIIRTMCRLLETQGYHATGLNQIVTESGTPKGSLYYYFPEGKDELTAEAVERTARIIEARIRESLSEQDEAAEAVRAFLLRLAHYVEESGYRAGGPITTVAMEAATASERVNEACKAAYQRWAAAFADRLQSAGYGQEQAEVLATVIIAAIEGATILSRTYRDAAPLRHGAEALGQLLRMTLRPSAGQRR